ncbi:hypothetical protein ACI2LJ_32825 [Streptomyces sp. NPDC088090]|uniref:hypothetical protein n=1 Tax=Streptomyces sp. NPDC088090 TaxID=3365822 RepID=UPI00384A491B
MTLLAWRLRDESLEACSLVGRRLIVAARAGDIREATGTLPDLGATHIAEHLADRFGLPADADTIAELARSGHIPRTGTYKSHTRYDSLALERFTDRDVSPGHRRFRLVIRSRSRGCVMEKPARP